MSNISEWDENTLSKFIVSLIRENPEIAALFKDLAKTRILKNGNEIGAQRRINFQEGSFDVKDRPDNEAVNVHVGGDGIRFNIDNEGGSLSITANNQIPDDQPGGESDNMIFIHAALDSDNEGGDLLIEADNNMSFTAVKQLDFSGETAFIDAGGTEIALGSTGLTIHLVSGMPLTVNDSSSNPVFKVDEDGDLHGKIGKSLTFDL